MIKGGGEVLEAEAEVVVEGERSKMDAIGLEECEDEEMDVEEGAVEVLAEDVWKDEKEGNSKGSEKLATLLL